MNFLLELGAQTKSQLYDSCSSNLYSIKYKYSTNKIGMLELAEIPHTSFSSRQ